MIGRLTFIAVLLTATVAAAQTAPPTPAEIASAHSQADAIIAAAQAGDVFENVTEDALPRVRHRKSGMSCIFDPTAPRNNVQIYPVSPATPERGDDVSCGTNFAGSALTTYATRYRPMPSVEEDMRSTVAGIRQAWPDAEPLEGEFSVGTVDGQTPPAFAAMTFRHPQGQQAASFAMISHVGEWSFKLRATGLAEDAQSLALIGGVVFGRGLPED